MWPIVVSKGAKRRRDKERVDDRERDSRPRRIADEAEIRVEDVDGVLPRGETDRGRAHVDHPVDWFVERGIAADAAGDHDVLHDLLVEGRKRDECEEQNRRKEERTCALRAIDRRCEEMRDKDVHPRCPGPPRVLRERAAQ
jgi:hypothetical protein